MYIPVDPFLSKSFWEKFSESLDKQKVSQVIFNGEIIEDKSPKILDKTEKEKLLNHLKSMKYVRLGCNRTLPLPSHFSVKFLGYNHGFLNDFIAIDSSPYEIDKEINFIIDFIFFDLPQLESLIIPFKINPAMLNSQFKIEFKNNEKETIISRCRIGR